MRRLDIGCGNFKMPNAEYLDIDPDAHPDILHDLNQYPYPVADNTYDEIYCKHIIEHLNEPNKFIREVLRVLTPGGKAYIETPHFTSRMAYSEPQHKHFFSYFMFVNITDKLSIKVLKHQLTFYKTFRHCGIGFLANKFPKTYERFWTYMFPAENIVFVFEKVGAKELVTN
jgi:SAM-dependent methyltransferase